ncbi:MAG: hypothetical protein QNJ92_10935 [Alphaproteobacteria bacterium]|nr:hypothetical protein [Alphaproteobacteria bacterium]
MMRSPNPTQEQADLPFKYACLSLFPILIFCLSETILGTLAHNSVPVSSELRERITFSDAGEAAARLRMLGMGLLVFLGAGAVLAKFFVDVRTHFAGPARTTILWAGGLVFIAGLVFLLLMYVKWIPIPRQRLGKELFDAIFLGVAESGRDNLWNETTYEVVTGLTHLAVVLSVAAFVAAAISCLAKLPGLDETENWRCQAARLKTYLFLSAGFLIMSVLYFKSWADYPNFLLAAEGTKSEFAQQVALANAYTTFTGIEYSLVLASYVLPASYIQSRRADEMAKNIVIESGHLSQPPPSLEFTTQVQAFKQDEHLEIASVEMVKIIFAIIGPLMTGALSGLATTIA